MKYVSLDIETTGTNPDQNDIIEFGAVIDDFANQKPIITLPKLRVIVAHHSYTGNAFAIDLNKNLFSELAKLTREDMQNLNKDNKITKDGILYCMKKELPFIFKSFLLDNGYKENEDGKIKITVAGKNVAGFDIPFLKKISTWNKCISASHKCLDPGILYTIPTDSEVPGMATCKIRAGLEESVYHTAIEDSIDVIKLLRYKLIKCQEY